MDKPWQDSELLNSLYHDEQISGPKIAELMGCSKPTVYRNLEDVRSTSEANRLWTWKLPLKMRTDTDGYEYFQTKIHGESERFSHHRLVAVSEHGLDAIAGKIIHHKNGIPWDNRPDNLEIMSQSDHVREHFEDIPKHEKAAMWALGKEDSHTAEDIGKMFGHSRSTVTTVWKRIDDGDYSITEATS